MTTTPSTFLSRAAGAAAASALAVALTSCGGGGASAEKPPASTPSRTSSTTAGGSSLDPDKVASEETVAVPGHPDEKVRVGVASIMVSGKLMELRLVLTPQYDDAGSPVSVYDMMGLTHYPALLDRANLKQYDVVRDEKSQVLESSSSAEAAKGASVGYQTFFPAPEEKVSQVDVTFPNGWPTLTDVPVTYED